MFVWVPGEGAPDSDLRLPRQGWTPARYAHPREITKMKGISSCLFHPPPPFSSSSSSSCRSADVVAPLRAHLFVLSMLRPSRRLTGGQMIRLPSKPIQAGEPRLPGPDRPYQREAGDGCLTDNTMQSPEPRIFHADTRRSMRRRVSAQRIRERLQPTKQMKRKLKTLLMPLFIVLHFFVILSLPAVTGRNISIHKNPLVIVISAKWANDSPFRITNEGASRRIMSSRNLVVLV